MKQLNRTYVLLVSATLFISLRAAGQKIIENQDSPIVKNPARTLQIKEVFRVEDKGKGFYFKKPWGLAVLEDGSIAVGDGAQVLKFAANGTFVKNLVRAGQGPGEISDFCTLRTDGERLFIRDHSQKKLVLFDATGKFAGEIRPGDFSSEYFLGVIGNRFFFTDSIYPPPQERKFQLYEIITPILVREKSDQPAKKIAEFRPKRFLMPQGAMAWDPFTAVLGDDGHSLFVNWTREYRIDKMDLETGEVTITFRRPFSRIRHVKDDWEDEFDKKYNPPQRTYDPDIKDFIANQDMLWVETAQSDKVKGRLYDIFDGTGRLRDSFYINTGLYVKAVQGRFIFAMEESEDGTLSFVKYKITDPLLRRP
jgi:hypothetical protein